MFKARQLLEYIAKSQFVRAIFFRIISVFLIMIVLLVGIVSYSFRAQIRRNIISDQKMQLDIVEDAISSRMEEVTGIAYNIGQDSAFYLKPISGIKYSGYEMSAMLSRYLIGNRFIEYLAYYRLSEPDRIYTSSGELSFHRFWDSYLDCDNYTEQGYLEKIKSNTGVSLIPLSVEDRGVVFFTYVCPLPQFSTDPQAFVIALIPREEIASPLSSQLANSYGEMSLFDASGNLIDQASTLDADIPAAPSPDRARHSLSYIRTGGAQYATQEKVSGVNGWTYISVVRLHGVLSALDGAQLLVIAGLVLLMIAAVCVILSGIIDKYKPISNLVQTLTDASAQSTGGLIDEKTLLSSTIATLKSDSEQKQMFEAAYQEATEASKAKSAFLSNMSHDIRTPMNAIIGMTGLAAMHADDTAYVRECLRKVDAASRYLLDIINNVLDMSRIESGRIALSEEEISLPDFVNNLIMIVHANIDAKRQRLKVETEDIRNEKVIGDGVRLTQVCMNILSNAVKFTPEGGSIRMRVRQAGAAEEGVGRYIFEFTDTGIGMPPEFIDKVFDAFSRAKESGVSKVEGTGLGMAIAKNLVELMGGDILCQSEQGAGTVFTVSLPLKLADAGLLNELTARAARYADKPVLIVGDDPAECAHQAGIFGEIGLTAQCAASAAQAAHMAGGESGRWRLVLINRSDGDASGIGAVTRLTEAKIYAKYALAANDFMNTDKAAASRAGIDAFVRLPLFASGALSALKCAEDPQKAPAEPEEYLPNLEGRRVLLAEDNPMNREIARMLIGETKAEVAEAVDGQEAVEAFAKRPQGYFGVILMDVQMPVMDGLAAAKAIRALNRPDAATVPIYAMTANTFDEDVKAALAAGMNGHLGKPYAAEELFRVLSRAMPDKTAQKTRPA